MSAPNWAANLVEPTLRFAEQFPAAFLRALLVRLEAHPEAIPAIRAALSDHAEFLRGVIAREAEGSEKAASEASARLDGILKTHRKK